MMHPLRVPSYYFEKPAVVILILERSVCESLDESQDRGERRTKFVGDVREELLSNSFKPLQPGDVVKNSDRARRLTSLREVKRGDPHVVDPVICPDRDLDLKLSQLSFGEGFFKRMLNFLLRNDVAKRKAVDVFTKQQPGSRIRRRDRTVVSNDDDPL